ncbi:MAG TPA: putative porin [Verrucomicrobiae bacterium]|jgi:hypothetical protein
MSKNNQKLAHLKILLATFAIAVSARAWCDGTTNTPASTTDPLLDLFVKKGYVTQQEADQVKVEAESMQTNNGAYLMPEQSRWKLDDAVKGTELFGDARMRYEDRTATDPAHNEIELQRLRYALRFGFRGDMFDNFYYGFRLETAANPRSPWVTAGQSGSTSPYQGPFGKSSAGLAVGQIYLGWRYGDWLDITVGKMPMPLYTTPMVWDSDISPEGAAEHFNYKLGPADLFANFGQFVYADLNPNNVSAGLGLPTAPGLGQSAENIFLFAWQGGVNYHFTTNTTVKVAATLYKYAGLKRSNTSDSTSSGSPESPYFGDPYVGEGAYNYYNAVNHNFAPGYAGYSPGTQFNTQAGGLNYGSLSYPFNQVGLDDLLVVEIPFEFNFRIKKVAARIFGDFAYNLQGRQRAEQAASAYSTILTANLPPTGNASAHSFPAQTDDVKAYQIGFGIGSDDLVYGPTQGLVYGTGAHKHDWEIRTYWQHIEQYALDPNIIDSDFFEGRENLQGVYASAAYALTGNVITTVRYGYAMRINNLLGTGGDNQDIPQMNPINHFYLLQVDATVRF